MRLLDRAVVTPLGAHVCHEERHGDLKDQKGSLSFLTTTRVKDKCFIASLQKSAIFIKLLRIEDNSC